MCDLHTYKLQLSNNLKDYFLEAAFKIIMLSIWVVGVFPNLSIGNWLRHEKESQIYRAPKGHVDKVWDERIIFNDITLLLHSLPNVLHSPEVITVLQTKKKFLYGMQNLWERTQKHWHFFLLYVGVSYKWLVVEEAFVTSAKNKSCFREANNYILMTLWRQTIFSFATIMHAQYNIQKNDSLLSNYMLTCVFSELNHLKRNALTEKTKFS